MDVVHEWFDVLDRSAEKIAKHTDVPYLEGLVMTADNIVWEKTDPEAIERELQTLYERLYRLETSAEQVRKALQLSILKGMKNASQPQHQMTPDAVALFISYLVNKFPLKDGWTLLDPAVGTGNLLTCVLNHAQKKYGQAQGVDVDELLIKLALSSVNLQQHDVELYRQDSLRPLLIDPVDIVLCDLPYGVYYDKENAKRFKTATTEKPLSQFLMIEQALSYTKPGGFLIFIIPNDLFAMDNDRLLHAVIQEAGIVLGILQLPKTMFRHADFAKSLLLLRKKGDGVKTPRQALLAELPSFKNREAMTAMMSRINQWFGENFSDGQ